MNCKFCAMTDIGDIGELITHIKSQHLSTEKDEVATRKNMDRLVEEVAKCWQDHH